MLLLISSLLAAQDTPMHGQTIESRIFQSEILQREIEYSIYLPPNYGQNGDAYPVLYALHSFGNTPAEYFAGIKFHQLTDKLIAEDVIPPFIIITPSAGITWYMNNYNNDVRYEDMFIQEFKRFIDENYLTREGRQSQALMGFSMGGSGSLLYAMKHPDLFGSAVGYCAGFSTKKQVVADIDSEYKIYHHSLYGSDLKGEARVNHHFLDNNPLYLAQSLDVEKLRSVRWFISTADLDYHSIGNAALHLTFREREIPHEFRVTDGGHNYEHVEDVMEEGLLFIGASFSH